MHPKAKGRWVHAPKGKIVKNTTRKKCVHCGQLILRKSSKIGATRCQILMPKCTKFDFRWGSAPDPAGGAYSAPPDRLTVFKGLTSKGREGERREGKRRGKGKGRGGKEGRGVKGKEGREGRKGEWEHAPIGIFESRRLWMAQKSGTFHFHSLYPNITYIRKANVTRRQ